MSFTKPQLIIISVALLLVVVFTLILIGVIPGLRPDLGTSTQLTIWGVHDDSKDFNFSALGEFGISVNYVKKDAATYETELLNALAIGRGPDIMMIHNDWLDKYQNKITPAPSSLLDIKTIDDNFPVVVSSDFIERGNIYALPLYIDTLALYYNKDLLDNENIATPPTTWEDFIDNSNELKELDRSNKIIRAGAAIGGSLDSVDRASDIIYLLMLQSGTKMTEGNKAIFADYSNRRIIPGIEAVSFYTAFSNPKNNNYTWNEDFINSIDGFSEGRVAMMIDYSHQSDIVSNKNPFLEFGISKVPQLKGASVSVNYPSYWGLAVLNQSRNKTASWQAVRALSLNESLANFYSKSTNKPPALRSLIPNCQRDTTLSAFCQQTLTARSWDKPEQTKTNNFFSEMIINILSGKLSISESLREAQDNVTVLINQ